MRSLIKKILGPRIRQFIRTIFPSEIQRKAAREEKEEIKFRSAFYSAFIRAGDLCFDVGANIGNRVNTFLYLGAKVVAVEPQEACYTILKKKYGGKIELVTKGLGEAETVKTFHLSNGSVLSSFSEDWINSVRGTRFKDYDWDRSVEVELTTLDKLIGTYGLPDFIKIDVEGYELEVLKGLSHPMKMISFEYTVPEQAHRPPLCLDQIQKHNKNIECNYCIGEDMAFILERWLTAEEMKEFIAGDDFINSGFGDIYVRTIS